jgi:hypothetical protein
MPISITAEEARKMDSTEELRQLEDYITNNIKKLAVSGITSMRLPDQIMLKNTPRHGDLTHVGMEIVKQLKSLDFLVTFEWEEGQFVDYYWKVSWGESLSGGVK